MHVVKLIAVLLLTAFAHSPSCHRSETAIDDVTSLLQQSVSVKHREDHDPHGEHEEHHGEHEEHHGEHEGHHEEHKAEKEKEHGGEHHEAPEHGAEEHGAEEHGGEEHGGEEHGAEEHGAEEHGAEEHHEAPVTEHGHHPLKPWWHQHPGQGKTITKTVQHVIPMQLGNTDCQAYMYSEAVSEFLGVTLFVFITCSCWMAIPNTASKNTQIALVAGLTFAALYYTLWHYSCGVPQLNMAISFSLWLNGVISGGQAWVNTMSQVLGSLAGSILAINFVMEKQSWVQVGTNEVHHHFTWFQAWFGEMFCTAMLVYVYLETNICDATEVNRQVAALAIGAAVIAGHCLLIPVDRCSMNPSKSFGPMAVKRMFRPGEYYTLIKGQHDTDRFHNYMHEETGTEPYFWQYWIIFLGGPMVGSIVASTMYFLLDGQMDVGQ